MRPRVERRRALHGRELVARRSSIRSGSSAAAARAWSACSPGSIAESDDPVLIAVHLASPVIQYLDRGKSGIALRGGDAPALRWSRRERRLITSRRWTPPTMARSPTTSSLRSRPSPSPGRSRSSPRSRITSAAAQRPEALQRVRRVSFKDAADEIMEEAYLKASADDTLPANARQIMYAARGHIQERTGKQLNDTYFTQTLLPDYISGAQPGWSDKVHYDNRGHFREPHTGREIGLGTAAVRSYLGRTAKAKIETAFETERPDLRPRLSVRRLCCSSKRRASTPSSTRSRWRSVTTSRFMSTKGISVTAARELAESLCSTLPASRSSSCAISTRPGLPEPPRSSAATGATPTSEEFEVVDLGLRLEDVRRTRHRRLVRGCLRQGQRGCPRREPRAERRDARKRSSSCSRGASS